MAVAEASTPKTSRVVLAGKVLPGHCSCCCMTNKIGNSSTYWRFRLGDDRPKERWLQVELVAEFSTVKDEIMAFGYVKKLDTDTTSYLSPETLLKSLVEKPTTDLVVWKLVDFYADSRPRVNGNSIGIEVYLTLALVEPRYHEMRPLTQIQGEVGCFQDDLCKLFKSGDHSDAVLEAEDRTIPVHKGILCSRSPVFKNVFETDMKEKRENKLVIDDVRGDVVEAMLEFVYTGRFQNMSEGDMSEQLYVLGDRYDIQDLKTAAMNNLCRNIDVKNVGRRILLAERYNHTQLRNFCLYFMRDNCAQLVESEGPLFLS